ncbi:MAG: hybrid sensor histidine kinase/response regulator, partial [Pseudomonadota bacterium]
DGGDTGLDVVDYLEATHKRQFPAIVVTASRSAETDAAIAAKGLTMLEKPVEPAALRAATISLLSARLD